MGRISGCSKGWESVPQEALRPGRIAARRAVAVRREAITIDGHRHAGGVAGGQTGHQCRQQVHVRLHVPQFTSYVEAGAQAMISSEVLFTPTNFQPSFTFYGLTFSTGTVTSGLLGGPIYSLGSLGSFNFYFDPYSLAAAVALATPVRIALLRAIRTTAGDAPGCQSVCLCRLLLLVAIPILGPASSKPSRTAASTPAWPGSSMSRAGGRSARPGAAARTRIVQASPPPSSSVWISPGST
jgi:hypothetical protein